MITDHTSELIAHCDALAKDNLDLIIRVDSLTRETAELRRRLGVAELAQEDEVVRANALQRELDDARTALRRYRERRITP